MFFEFGCKGTLRVGLFQFFFVYFTNTPYEISSNLLKVSFFFESGLFLRGYK